MRPVPEPEPKPAALIQSVDRAISVLELLAKQGQAGITEIAEELGVHKSTASRLMSVLENRGLVEQQGMAREVRARLRHRPAGGRGDPAAGPDQAEPAGLRGPRAAPR